MKQTLYDILGVSREASPEEIAVAYQSRLVELESAASRDPTVLTLVREAHAMLSDAARRAVYDALLAARAAREAGAARGESEDLEPDEPFPTEWWKWAVGVAAVVAIAAGLGWKTHHSPPVKPAAPPPVATVAPTEPEPEPAQSAAPPAASATAPAPAAVPAPSASPAEGVFAKVSPSVARVNVMDASGRTIAFGSGVVVDRETVVTTCHLLTRGVNINVKLGSAVRAAEVQASDEERGLCRLSVSGLGAPAARLGSVKRLRSGQRVYAIGAYQGEAADLAISEGIVASLREVPGGTVIQTTVPIPAGASGGGLFDLSGRLVGILTSQHRYEPNLNLALPADWIGEIETRSAATAPTARP